jgi:hypothetical protein
MLVEISSFLTLIDLKVENYYISRNVLQNIPAPIERASKFG